jgi:hypothetical protein
MMPCTISNTGQILFLSNVGFSRTGAVIDLTFRLVRLVRFIDLLVRTSCLPFNDTKHVKYFFSSQNLRKSIYVENFKVDRSLGAGHLSRKC